MFELQGTVECSLRFFRNSHHIWAIKRGLCVLSAEIYPVSLNLCYKVQVKSSQMSYDHVCHLMHTNGSEQLTWIEYRSLSLTESAVPGFVDALSSGWLVQMELSLFNSAYIKKDLHSMCEGVDRVQRPAASSEKLTFTYVCSALRTHLNQIHREWCYDAVDLYKGPTLI